MTLITAHVSYRRLPIFLTQLRDHDNNNGEPSLSKLKQIITRALQHDLLGQEPKQSKEKKNSSKQSKSSSQSSKSIQERLLFRFCLKYRRQNGSGTTWTALKVDQHLMRALQHPPQGGLNIRVFPDFSKSSHSTTPMSTVGILLEPDSPLFNEHEADGAVPLAPCHSATSEDGVDKQAVERRFNNSNRKIQIELCLNRRRKLNKCKRRVG